LRDEQPERIAGLFDELAAGFAIRIGRPRTGGKRRQRAKAEAIQLSVMPRDGLLRWRSQ
jgi:hypothetical protein